ncbi:MAG: AlkA N-terminal domain-containing protein [Solirubrobacteraceae bacterium]
MRAFTAVRTTGVFCLPGCAGRPKPENTRRFELAAAAEAAGYRACLRCRPYRIPASLDWTAGPELVCRAVHMVIDGTLHGGLDGRGEDQLARALRVCPRDLRRLLALHTGATPDQLARSCASHFARRLLDDTDLPPAQVALASGFGAVRQLDSACREIFGEPPLALRARRRRTDPLVAGDGLPLRLSFRGPLDFDAMLSYFRARAIPGVEHVNDTCYRRTVVVDGAPGVLEFTRAGGREDQLILRAHLARLQGLIHVVARARRIFSLDAPCQETARCLAGDPIIGPLARGRPGLRVPGSWDAYETGVRAIIGQQVSVAGASTLIGRLARQVGEQVPGLERFGLSHSFPPPEVLATADLSRVGLTRARQSAIQAFAGAVIRGEIALNRSAPLTDLVDAITAVRGLGPWTAQYIALRLGERDAFPSGDLGLRRAIGQLQPAGSASLQELAESWSPWRATAAIQLWSADSALERGQAPRCACVPLPAQGRELDGAAPRRGPGDHVERP